MIALLFAGFIGDWLASMAASDAAIARMGLMMLRKGDGSCGGGEGWGGGDMTNETPWLRPILGPVLTAGQCRWRSGPIGSEARVRSRGQ